MTACSLCAARRETEASWGITRKKFWSVNMGTFGVEARVGAGVRAGVGVGVGVGVAVARSLGR